MSTGRRTMRGKAFQSRAFVTWALAGARESVARRNRRHVLIGTSTRVVELIGTSEQQQSLFGTSTALHELKGTQPP